VARDWFTRKVMGTSRIVGALRRATTRLSYGEVRRQDVSWLSLKQPRGQGGKEGRLREREREG
jgi:hypothetical protein